MAAREVQHLLIGGGLAGASCATRLREQGDEGAILLVGRELDPPYERPPCSKGYLRGSEEREAAFVHPPQWWQEHDVEVLTRTSVTALDPAARTATLSNREQVRFESALIATGANVRLLEAPGEELDGIHYLRTLRNSDSIRAEIAPGCEVALIGGSYIACEVAASLAAVGCNCTILMQERHTLERSFGAKVAAHFQQLLESHGVRVHAGESLERFEGSGRVQRVVCESGLEVPADLVVIGAGVHPEVHLARAAGLQIGQSGGIRCSSRLETSVSGIFAAGDVCEYESVVNRGARLRVEHWDVALQHGRTAAMNMLGADRPHEVVPYFFSDLSDWLSLEYVGPAREWDREVLRGSLEAGEFSCWYISGGRVAGALSVGRSADLDAARELISSGLVLAEEDLGALADTGSELPRA